MEAEPRSNAPSSCDLRLEDTAVRVIASRRRPARRRDPARRYAHPAPLADMLTALGRTMNRRDAAVGERGAAPGTAPGGRVVSARADELAAGPGGRVGPRDWPRTHRSRPMCGGDVLCSEECANSR